MRRLSGIFQHYAAFAIYVGRRFRENGGLQIASALSYTTLLSLIPLLAVSLAVLSGFGALEPMRDAVQELLLELLLPSIAGQITEYILRFLENARQLTAIGLVGLTVTAIMVLGTIEGAFNRIWQARATRHWAVRLLVFWAVLTFGPVALGISLSLTETVRTYTGQTMAGGLLDETGAYVSFILQWALLSLMYTVVPAVRVRARDAAIGGLIAALLVQGLKLAFAVFVSSFDNYRAIYGALAAVPILLIWLYAFWTMLLIGAEVTAALPERARIVWPGRPIMPSREARLAAALALLATLWAAAGTTRSVSLRHPSVARAGRMLPRLTEAGLIVLVEEKGLMIGCDYARTPIATLWRALDFAAPRPEDAAQSALLAPLIKAENDVLQRPLTDILPSGKRPPEGRG